jgi:hypothetical protein
VALPERREPVGRWSEGGRLIEVVRRDGELVVVVPDVPEQYAPRLHGSDADPAGPLVMLGGPYHGLTVETVQRDGVDHLLIGGVVTLPPWRAPAGGALIRGLPAWPDQIDADTERRYANLLGTVRGAGGAVVQPPADVALGSWVGWLTDQDAVLFHGSADGGIDVLHPRRTSYEFDDQAQRGNRAAVYATDDGWWAMWFSVIHRARLRGSMRNGVETFVDPHRRRLRVYHFSVDYRVLPSRPFHDGWLYVVPRDTFEQLPVMPGGPPSHEWCSRQPVTPLARLPVRPADFPFLDRVSSHDDGDLYRFDELTEMVRERVAGGTRTPDGVALRVRWDDRLAGIREEYLDLGHRIMPEITRSFHHDADGVDWLYLGSSGALVLMLQNRYANLMDRRVDGG